MQIHHESGKPENGSSLNWIAYRMNPELKRVEFWHVFDATWASVAEMQLPALEIVEYLSLYHVSFDDTWAEPIRLRAKKSANEFGL